MRQQTVKIERAARFRTGARQAFAAERLYAHHRADHIAVDVEVADFGALRHLRDGLIDAGMHAQRQAIAGGVDLLNQLRQRAARKAHHMQHWTEHLFIQLVDAVQLDQRRHNKGAGLPLFAVLKIFLHRLEHRQPFSAHRLNMTFDILFRFGIDHRADIGREPLRVAHAAFRHRAAQHLQRMVGDIVLNTEQTQRRAALSGAVIGGGDDIQHHLFRQGGRIDDHRIHAAGFGDQRRRATLRIETSRQVALQQRGDRGRAGKHHTAHALVAGQLRADGFAEARQQLHHASRHACLQQNAHRLRGDQRRLFRRFRQHAVACRQRGGDLAGENRQREVPRADADDRAERTMGFIIEIALHQACVVVKEIDRFSHFGDGIAEGFARFAHQNADKRLHLAFHHHRGALQNGGALLRRRGEPDRPGVDGSRQRLRHFLLAGLAYFADDIGRVGRVKYRTEYAVAQLALDHRFGAPRLRRAAQQGAGERSEAVLIRQIQPGGVGALVAIKIARQRNFRMRQADGAFSGGQALHQLHRIGHQLVERQRIVGDAVDERGVSAVFQQAAHQVSQQRFMGTDRGIDAAGTVQLAVGDFAHHLLVERLAHAVQALELILARIVVVARHMVDRRQAVGIMGGKLRIDQVRHRQ